MKNISRLILAICIIASASSYASLAQRLIIQFSDILSETEQTAYQKKIDEVAPAGFKILKYDRRWILTLPPETTSEQVIEITKELSQLGKVDFIEKDLPMKKLQRGPT